MDRARYVGSFWNWLPTFRVVAETEHVAQAAHQLGVTPPAVTRTVSLLEEELGVSLLERHGRGVRLTEAGHLLQGAVRNAMRTVHETATRLHRGGHYGRITISAVSPLREKLLWPAVRQLHREHPQLRVTTTLTAVRDVESQLLSGRLDVALIRQPIAVEGLTQRFLGEEPLCIAAPARLGLSEKRRYQWSELGQLPHIAVDETWGQDPFPRDLPRTVALTVTDFDEAASAALSLSALAVLPRSLVSAAEGLVPLRTAALRPLRLVAVWRQPVSLETAADAFVAALCAASRAALAPARD